MFYQSKQAIDTLCKFYKLGTKIKPILEMNVAPKAKSWTGSGWDDDILLWYYEDQEIVKQRNEAIGASGTHPQHGGGKFATPTSIHSTLPQALKSTHKQYCATHNHSEHPHIDAIQFHTVVP